MIPLIRHSQSDKIMTEIISPISGDQGLVTVGQENSPWDDKNILYLDCGSGYTT